MKTNELTPEQIAVANRMGFTRDSLGWWTSEDLSPGGRYQLFGIVHPNEPECYGGGEGWRYSAQAHDPRDGDGWVSDPDNANDVFAFDDFESALQAALDEAGREIENDPRFGVAEDPDAEEVDEGAD